MKSTIDAIEVNYQDLHEICQGCPEIGSLSIGGRVIYCCLFGGPFLYEDENLYVPKYVEGFFGGQFQLVKINIKTLEQTHIGKARNLISLDKIEGTRVFYFEDVSKVSRSFFEL